MSSSHDSNSAVQSGVMSDDILQYMYSLERFGITPGLERMQLLMESLKHPETAFESIHITGTNGKGSTAAMMASVLSRSGKKVGLYTSPHIYTFNERIQVDGKPITSQSLNKHILILKKIIEQQDIQASFFEFTTALAYLEFAQQHVDIAVVEVGMGGRYDATNVITPRVSVITNVGLDHMEFLGHTKEEIAWEKAGIIKKGVPVVTCERDPNILDILRKEASSHQSELTVAQDIVHIQQTSQDLFYIQPLQHLMVSGAFHMNLELPLLGVHQIHNVTGVLATINELRKQGMNISDIDIQEGIKNVEWEGRLDIVSKHPLIIVDGAHNEDGVHTLVDMVSQLPTKDVLIIGLKKGKVLPELTTNIASQFKRVIITQGNFQPEDMSVISDQLRHHPHVHKIPSVEEAIVQAKDYVGRDGTIFITGSLYMIADALGYLRGKS